MLDALSELYDVVGNNERALSYQRAASILRSLPRRYDFAVKIAKYLGHWQ